MAKVVSRKIIVAWDGAEYSRPRTIGGLTGDTLLAGTPVNVNWEDEDVVGTKATGTPSNANGIVIDEVPIVGGEAKVSVLARGTVLTNNFDHTAVGLRTADIDALKNIIFSGASYKGV